ncbi:MAG: CoB--CoM heterodisulfide reductase subunit B [Candidatus Bathyarchaeota archaeon]|nr:MAG: CoB--CoM heterodisulfide reductase subunit B [Candidatus Bathyarchaeota archaeon]
MKMSEYALFLGCMTPIRLPYMESSARTLLGKFGVDLVDIPGTGCCPDPSLRSVDQLTWTSLAARNLVIAEEIGLDIITLCNGCFETLKTVNVSLKNDDKLRALVDKRLARVGKEFRGDTEVYHLVEVLNNDIGLEKISDAVVRPLKGLRVAAHYGCHLLRPNSILDVDDPVRPVLLDRLIELTGATSVPYYKKNMCCGAGTNLFDSDTAKELVKYKLGWVKRAGANCMSVVCPFCMFQYDVVQRLVRDELGDRFITPVLYYPEMLLLALGSEPEELALDMHRTSVQGVIDSIQGGHSDAPGDQ